MARPTLETSVKFKLLIRLLSLDKPYVRGLLETFWDVANACGNPIIGNDKDVEAAAEWPGKPGAFFQAMRESRLIDEREDGQWEVHDYWDHAPEYVKGRLRKELERKRKNSVTRQSRDSHATVTQTADTPSPSPSPKRVAASAATRAALPEDQTPDSHTRLDAPARRELLDTLAEVTASDPKLNGSHLGRACKVLGEADPPYTAADVRRLIEILPVEFPWLQGRPTIGVITKYIGATRGKCFTPPGKQPQEKTPEQKEADAAAAKAAYEAKFSGVTERGNDH